MQALAEGVFTGNWRSFKIFKRTGAITLQTNTQFSEFDFECNRELIIKKHNGSKTEQVAQTDEWTVVFQNKKHYISITKPKILFEIITVNHTVMVLADNNTGEKTFFARIANWQDYLQSNLHPVL